MKILRRKMGATLMVMLLFTGVFAQSGADAATVTISGKAMKLKANSASKKIKGFALNKNKAVIAYGKKLKLSAVLKPSGLTGKYKNKVKWGSSVKKVAAVNKKGVVTGKKAGNTVITGYIGNKSARCTVTVYSTTPAAGNGNSFFINSGVLYGVGNNSSGQLGDGTNVNKAKPVKIMSGVSEVKSGGEHTLILKNNNSLWAVGNNVQGQLGDGTTTNRLKAVRVMTKVKHFDVSYSYSTAVKKDGSVWAWGYNGRKQINQSGGIISSPLKVASDCVEVAAGMYKLYVLKKDGSMINITDNNAKTAAGVKSIYAGREHFAYITKKGNRLFSFGLNNFGQLGIGNKKDSVDPVLVAKGVKSAALGNSHTIFLKTNGTLWSTGRNGSGQLGTGNKTDISSPKKILNGIEHISSGGEHSVAVKKNNVVFGFGLNDRKQINNSSAASVVKPEKLKVK